MTQPPLATPFRIGDVTIANRVLMAPLAGILRYCVILSGSFWGAASLRTMFMPKERAERGKT